MEDGAFRFDKDQVFLVGGAWWEGDSFFSEYFVVIDDVIVHAFVEDERIVPQLDQVKHFCLDFVPVVRVGTQVLQEAALPAKLNNVFGTRLRRESTRCWNEALFAA